ncbi:MAG: D-alanine--D-alanine ligase family protein, partial [Bacteroidota bacterium]
MKKHIAIVFGGKSPEHEVSVRSAKTIISAIDRGLFDLTLLGIDRSGIWRRLENENIGKYVPETGPQLAFSLGEANPLFLKDSLEPIKDIDLMYLVLHGPNGEDGTVQGLVRLLGYPFIGPDVLGASAAMDKEITKRLLEEAGVQVAPGITAYDYQVEDLNYEQISAQLGRPIFIKPANMGSSVGVHKVRNQEEFDKAISDAFLYDRKILIESMIHGREVECAVMGNSHPKASTIGEIVTAEEYSFEEKYADSSATMIHIPAKIDANNLERLREVAIKAYRAVDCEVLTRVDMFLTDSGEIYVNELNTLPGFTSISMYPKLWEHEGLTYTDLITK